MARSKIITEILNGEMSLSLTLKRLKVLLYNFDNEEIMNWVNNELKGYPDKSNLPFYRIWQGRIYATMIMGNQIRKNVPIPNDVFPEELKDKLTKVRIYESIESVTSMKEDESAKIYTIPPKFNKYIYQIINEYIEIHSAFLIISPNAETEILSNVSDKTLEILLFLEKEYGNLDEFDIDFSIKSQEETKVIVQNIYNIVFDSSITMGNENTLKNTEISSNMGEN